MASTSNGSGSAGSDVLASLPKNAELAEPTAGHVAHGSGLALMRIEVPDGDEVRGELVAIDLAPRSIRWTAPDIATECKPTVIDGVGVRQEERRVGQEGVRPCRSRWRPY